MIPLRDNTPSRTFPFVNIFLILLNAAAFVYELRFSTPQSLETFIMSWALIPKHLLATPVTEWVTIPASMFLHGGWAHILGNMLYLWIFGDNVEDRVGHIRYFFFYLLVGTAAALTQTYAHPASGLPMIGASGAIAGVLGAYFVLYPRARVMSLVPVGFFLMRAEIPAFFFLLFWFLVQSLQSVGSLTARAVQGDVGGVAWFAHAGGFVAGFVLIWFFKKPSRRGYLS
jgi:membrane associated rhomboid family serine protease